MLGRSTPKSSLQHQQGAGAPWVLLGCGEPPWCLPPPRRGSGWVPAPGPPAPSNREPSPAAPAPR